jgi:dephospho-CoA kinase
VTKGLTRIIGLTGGIATGKSTVADYLAKQDHCTILDADLYAREAVAIGSPILQEIFQRYGDGVRNADGTLDRQRLGNIVFHDGREKQWLESRIHPYVRERFEGELATLTQPVKVDQNNEEQNNGDRLIVCVIPLLIEANLMDFVSEIWVVTCGLDQQLDRLQKRNQLSLEQAQARIQSQMPLAEKIKFADVVLDNSLDLATLQHQVDQALKRSC